MYAPYDKNKTKIESDDSIHLYRDLLIELTTGPLTVGASGD
jgi:hypothetical protein